MFLLDPFSYLGCPAVCCSPPLPNMLHKSQQQRDPAPAPAPDAPSTSISTSGEEQQEEVAAVSGRSKVPGSNPSVDAALHRRRNPKSEMDLSSASERSPLLDEAGREASLDLDSATAATSSLAWSQRNQWIIFAIASGTCAALNGVMAKL